MGRTGGSSAQPGTPRELEHGIDEVLSHLERTVQAYEKQLAQSQASNVAGTGRGRGATPPSDLNRHQRPGSRASAATTYDPEKQKKLQALMNRIKYDIGQMKEALGDEEHSQLPITNSLASPSHESRPIDLRSRQGSRGRRQQSSS